ncbi:MAG TPA: hypothetical protein VFD46_14290, partial [Chryseolinea sp.]|nr:hypothetical protein [Chryseolinea sp.]
MFLDKDVTLSNFFVRLKNWEYWPFGIVQFPVMLYFFWLSLRARSFLFFSASNPGITMGGMFGESKYDVLKLIPARYIPVTLYVKEHTTTADVLNILRAHCLELPVIFKPDLGERGFMVKRINTESEIKQYCTQLKHPFLIQELVDLPLEFGVFYLRYPHHHKGKVTSVV